jgi:uncharacterized membrane protein
LKVIQRGKIMMKDGMGFGMIWLSPMIWIFIIGVILWGVMFLINRISGQQKTNVKQPEDVALDVLRKRYTLGELSEEQFKIIKNNLQS